MKRSLLLISLFASALSLQAASPSAQAPKQKAAAPQKVPPGVEIIRDVEVGAGGGRTLHVVIARPKEPPKTPMPAVLWIHGGGWSGGSHAGNTAMWLATNGYFTASVEYRLSGEAKWPAQIEDCKLAVRWLRANAAKYRVNPAKIGCWGSSAGGHLVAFLGVSGDMPEFEGKGGYAGVSSRVQAVVDFCGPADMTGGSLGIQGATGDKDAQAPLGLAGAPFKEKPEIWRQMSPLTHVSPKAAPFLIVHGDKDTTVPILHSQRLEAALKKAGVPVELLTVKGGGHGMAAATGEPPAEPDQAGIRAGVLAFFDKNLKQ
jgi:acetyl esterase/lipase